MREFINITKALADQHRVRMLLALRAGELCVCQITELFGLAASTTSKHLSILYQARLVESRKEGRWIYYALPGKGAPADGREAMRWVQKALAGEARVLEDEARLKKSLAWTLSSYASANVESESPVPLHREFVPQPNG